jgi:hypothetical protein
MTLSKQKQPDIPYKYSSTVVVQQISSFDPAGHVEPGQLAQPFRHVSAHGSSPACGFAMDVTQCLSRDFGGGPRWLETTSRQWQGLPSTILGGHFDEAFWFTGKKKSTTARLKQTARRQCSA